MKLTCTFAIAIACFASAAFAQEQSKDLLRPPEQLINIRALAFSPDGRLLAGCSGEPTDKAGEVVVWDAKTQKMRWNYNIDKGMPSVAFSPDGKTLAVGSYTERCFLFNTDTGKLRSTLPGHGQSVRCLAFAPDGAILAIGSYDENIRLWDWRAGKLIQTIISEGDKIYSLAYSASGKILGSGSATESACLWDASSSKLLYKWKIRSVPLAFDPGGKWLATAGNDSTLSLRSIEDYEKILAHYDRIYAYRILIIHPSARSYVAHSGMDKVVRVYPIDLREPSPADEKEAQALVALWDSDSYDAREKASQDLIRMGNVGTALLSKAVKESASAEVRIRARGVLRALEAPKPLAELRGHEDNIMAAAFSPDGQILATASRDGQIFLWDTATYKLMAMVKWPRSAT